MFARVALADLFIHGIGGAKYDEATDAICQAFFGAAPPEFAVVTGTLRLPVAHPPGGDDEVRQWRRRLRDLEYHPERQLGAAGADGAAPAAAAFAEQKRRAVALTKTPANAAARHLAIAEANRGLAALLGDARQRTEAELAGALDRRRANRIWDSREYAFCLFPRDLLREFLLDFDR
jgi:hypothetical protein